MTREDIFYVTEEQLLAWTKRQERRQIRTALRGFALPITVLPTLMMLTIVEPNPIMLAMVAVGLLCLAGSFLVRP